MQTNDDSITHFNDISKIKGISQITIDKLRKFCESKLQEDQKHANNFEIPTDCLPEPQNMFYNDDIQPRSDNFVFYDETIPPIDFHPTETNLPLTKSNSKAFKFLIEPKLKNDASIQSFTSIYLDGNAVTCTRFSARGKWSNGITIESWDQHKVHLIGVKNLHEMCNQLSQFVNQLPASDVYIVDDHNEISNLRKAILPKRVSEIIQSSQKLAILVTLLKDKERPINIEVNDVNVFLMAYSNVGKLYNLFVKHEVVASESKIRSILDNSNINLAEPSEPSFIIEVDDNIRHKYFKLHPTNRENFGKSMLIGLTFIRLGIFRGGLKKCEKYFNF